MKTDEQKASVSKKAGMKRVRHKAYSYEVKGRDGKTVKVTVAAHFEWVRIAKPKSKPQER